MQSVEIIYIFFINPRVQYVALERTVQYGYFPWSHGTDHFYWGMHNAKQTSIYNHTASPAPGDNRENGLGDI